MHWWWVAVGYVTYLAAVSLVSPAFRSARRWLLPVGASIWLVASSARLESTPIPIVTVLLPAALLIAGYWLSGLFFVAPNVRLEGWLLAIDQALLGHGGHRDRRGRGATVAAECLEVSYLLVYAAIPAGAVVLAATGHLDRVDSYWTTVLLAEFCCYGMLPWIQTRPPRVLEELAGSGHPGPVRRVNLCVTSRASIQANTIPSGHAAGAVAAALAIGATLPLVGGLFLVLAASITVATVAGRYHYTVDAVLGATVGLVVGLGIGR